MPTPISIAREALATLALSYLGQDCHEQVWLDVLRPPHSHPVDKRGVPLSWCRAFVLYCLRERYRAAHGAEPPEDWIWIPGRGFEYPLGLHTVSLPEVGDEAFRIRDRQTGRLLYHGAIVTQLHGDGTITTVDGNAGVPGAVRLRERTPIDQWDTFFDLEPMLL